MANTDYAVGLKDLLVAAGLGTFGATTGWAIMIARETDAPDTQIVCYNTGGLTPNPKWGLDYPSLMTRVRGARDGYQAAYAKAVAVKDALLGLPSQDINGDRWVAVNGIGDINNLGFDNNNRPIFTLNWSLIVEPDVTGSNRSQLP